MPATWARDAALEAVSEGVLVRDVDGDIVLVNSAFELILGLPPGWRFAPESFRRLIDTACADVPGDGVRELPNGRVAACRSRPLPDGGIVHTLRDVTEERQAQRRLAEGERLLRETLDGINAAVVVYDADDRFVLGNRRYFDLYPHLPDDGSLVGTSYEQMLRRTMSKAPTEQHAVDDPEGFIARQMRSRRRGGDREQLHRNGRWYLLRSQRTPTGHLVTLRVDVTELKQLQLALAAARDEIEKASAAKSAFLAAMSHEIRTPLNAVLGFADLLGCEVFGPLGSERYRSYAADILQAGRHLQAVIGDILDLAKIESGRMELVESEFPLRALIESELAVVRPDADRRGLALVLDMSDAEPALRADRRLVAQILLNLLSNALKFTPAGRVAVRLVRDAEGGLAIAVEDTGIGIPAEVVAQLGQPYFQVDPDARASCGGTGLGLSLVKEMMALHGGAVEIRSVEGAGTTVAVRFPPERVT